MKKHFLYGCIFLFDTVAFAQALDLDAQRLRLQEVRQTELRRFAQQEVACYQLFTVNDCLRQVRVDKRLALDALRLKELALNDKERQQKGLVARERIQEKSSPEALEEAASRRTEAVEAQKEREASAARKAAEDLQFKSQAKDVRTGKPPVNASRAAEDEIRNRQEFDAKLKEAEEHRASREKSHSEKASTPKKPLPLE